MEKNQNHGNENAPSRAEIENAEEAVHWSPVPESGKPMPGTKMDWITGLPFKSERGVELQPEETVKFFHYLA